ncbi:MAG: FHA domain-containing protein [Acidimicrobiia bacterium]
MEPYIEVWHRDGVEKVPLTGTEVTVGRADGNDIVIDDPAVSRHHLVFERLAAGWSAHDVHSLNGTLVNGEPIVAGRPLYHDDQIRVGDTKIVYRTHE